MEYFEDETAWWWSGFWAGSAAWAFLTVLIVFLSAPPSTIPTVVVRTGPAACGCDPSCGCDPCLCGAPAPLGAESSVLVME